MTDRGTLSNTAGALGSLDIYSEKSLKRIAVINALLWFLLNLGLAIWMINNTRNNTYEVARNQARALFTKDVIYRNWSASHGGVYVPSTQKTPPNPYLKDVKKRDITTSTGKKMTLINPAYMTRQVHQIGDEMFGFKANITSLKPLRPENKADPWETRALNRLEQGDNEFFERTDYLGQDYFRYMQLLRVREACLTCHEQQGYKIGDVRGGISISLSATPFINRMQHEITVSLISFIILCALGLTGIYFAYRRTKNFIRIQNSLRSWLVESNDSQRVLNQMMDVSLNDLSMEQLLQHVLEQLLTVNFFKLMPMGGIFMKESGSLHLKAAHNLPEELKSTCQQVKLGQCLCGKAAESQQILFKSCLDGDHQIRYQGITEHAHYIVPIVYQKQLLGVIVLYLPHEHQQQSREVQFLQNVSVNLAQLILRKQELEKINRLAQIVEQSPESIVITNLNAEIEYVNNAFTLATGFKSEEVLGQNPKVLHSGHTPQETYEELWKTLCQGKTWQGQFYNKNKQGQDYIEFAIISPLRDQTGKIKHYMAIKEDITEKKRMGDELEQHRNHLEEMVQERTNELQEARKLADAAEQAKTSFLRNIGHEFRTPMNQINGMTYLLLEKTTDAEQKQQINLIIKASNTLETMLEDLLIIANAEKDDEKELNEVVFQVGEIIKQAAEHFTVEARLKQLDFVIDNQLSRVAVVGDLIKLNKILHIILSNAIKFTAQGIVEFKAQELFIDNHHCRYIFAIKDSGIGMSKSVKNKIFNLFQQGQDSIQRQYGGTGVGLALAKLLVEKMQGKISVVTEENQGSCFKIELPFKINREMNSFVEVEKQDDEQDTYPHQPEQNIDPQVLINHLRELEQKLALSDVGSETFFRKNQVLLLSAMAEKGRELEYAIEMFDYPQARQIVLDFIDEYKEFQDDGQ